MKKLLNIAALLTMLAAFVSCSDNFEDKNFIRFSARTGDPGTKVSYSGYKESNKERVDWSNGDMVWIWCPESQRPVSHESYYVVNNINPNGFYSDAGIELYSTEGTIDGLKWNDAVNDHHFFSVYPVPLKNNSVFFRLVLNSNGQWDDSCSALYGATVPSSQAPKSITAGTDGTVAEPDGNNLIMAAEAVYPLNSVVTLNYQPVVTAVEFIVKNGYADQGTMTLRSIKLSAESAKIAGKFTNVFDSATATFERTSTEIEIPFDDSPVTIAYDQTLKFTVFMLGKENANDAVISDMTIEFVTGADAEATKSIKTKLQTSQGLMEFPRAKKSYVTGLLIPGECVWTISAVPDTVTAWDQEDMTVEVEDATPAPNPGGGGGGGDHRSTEGPSE